MRDIVFVLRPNQKGKVVKSEAVEKVLDYGFSYLGLNVIYGEVDPQNISSSKLIKQHDFTLDTIKEKSQSISWIKLDKYGPKLWTIEKQ